MDTMFTDGIEKKYPDRFSLNQQVVTYIHLTYIPIRDTPVRGFMESQLTPTSAILI